MHLLVTRPEPDATALAEELAGLGHTTIISPLLETVLQPEALDGAEPADGLIATSRNAIRALERSPAIAGFLAKPVYCVGPGTADLARAAGFANVIAGAGNATDLAHMLADTMALKGKTLLRLAGRLADDARIDIRDILEPAGLNAPDVFVYRVRSLNRFSPETVAALRAGTVDGVILMSPATARAYAKCLDAAGITDVTRLHHFCLSENVATATAVLRQCRITIADAPNRASLLTAIDRSCGHPSVSDCGRRQTEPN